jgi:ATP-dependent helicase/nuclease subunit B
VQAPRARRRHGDAVTGQAYDDREMSSSPSPIELTVVGYGKPALDSLCRRVAEAKTDDPLAPVTVVVPNNFVGVATRRALASGVHGSATGIGRGLVAVDFLTLFRLAERLGSQTLVSAGRRPVSTPVIAAAVRRVLSEAPGIFAPVRDHPTTERRLVRAHRELSDVDPAGIDALRRAGRRASEVVRVHEATSELLAPGWFSEQDLIDSAIGALHASSAGVELESAIVFLPDQLSPPLARLVKSLAVHVGVEMLVASTGARDADAPLRASLALLDLELPPSPGAPPPVVVATNVADPDDEVRHVVRQLITAAADGIAFDRMAVIYATDSPYARLLHDHLSAASIPFNGAAVSGLDTSVAGRTLLRMLSLTDRDMRREDVLGMVTSLPLTWRNRPLPTRVWEQISREAGVVRGLDDWRLRIDRYRSDRQGEAADIESDPEQEWRVARLRGLAEQASDLLDFVETLHRELDNGSRAHTWAKRVAWCRRVLHRYLGDQADWPDSEVTSAERLDAALERLSGLDDLDDPCTGPVFRRTLSLELEGGLGRVGRLGEGVLIGRAWSVAGLSLDHIWVMGMSEGSYPSRPSDDSLLPDRERALTGGQLRLLRDRVGLEHRHLLAAGAAVAPNGTLHLTRSRGDLRTSSERSPSRWLHEMTFTTADGAQSDIEVPSFAHGIAQARFPATRQEVDLQALLAGADHPAAAEILSEPAFAASVEATVARNTTSFTRFDGNVPSTLVPPIDSRATSATALETWADCPHAYFMRQLLSVYPIEAPELRLRIDPLTRGTLVHSILERFVGQTGVDAAYRRWNREDEASIMKIADQAFADVEARGLTGQALYWRRDQVLIRRDLLTFLDADNERRTNGGLRPLSTEMAFGSGDNPAISIRVPDGRRVPVRGTIDRVDVASDGALHVIDYKTGRDFKISPDAPHANGTRLQLVIYAQAARQALGRPDAPIHSSYWFVSRKGGFKQAGYEVTDAISTVVNDAIATIVTNIEAGCFPQRPDAAERSGAYIHCPYCDPDGLGTRSVRRRLEAIAGTRELVDYIALAEPDLIPPPTLPEVSA